MSNFFKKINQLTLPKEVSALSALIAMAIVVSFLTPHFLTITNLKNVFVQASVVAILASGMTLVIITGGIDLSVGTVMTMSSCIFGTLYLLVHFNFFLALLLGMLSGTLAGTISGTLAAKGDIPPFIATLGMMGIAQGIALLITAGYSLYQFPEAFLYMAHGEVLGIPIPMLIVAIVYVAMYFVAEYTRLGRYAYAIGGNENAAELSGVAVDNCKIMIFALNGFLASLAGVVMTARNASAHPGLGTGFELDAIAAVVIGGTSLAGGEGTIIGTIIGALIMAVIKNSLNLLGVSPFIQRIAIGAVIILAVLLDSASKKRALKIKKVS